MNQNTIYDGISERVRVNNMNYEVERDNWIEEERARERKISIWAMYDNQKDALDSHEEYCDRRAVEEEHIEAHQMTEKIQNRRKYSNTKMSKQQENAFQALLSIIIAVIMMFVFLIVTY